MSDTIKGALVIAISILIAAGLYVYFSPYQTCVRGYAEEHKNTAQNPTALAQRICAQISK